MIDDDGIREALLLVREGVPFDVAFALEPAIRQGFCITFAELRGAKFNRRTMRFEEPK